MNMVLVIVLSFCAFFLHFLLTSIYIFFIILSASLLLPMLFASRCLPLLYYEFLLKFCVWICIEALFFTKKLNEIKMIILEIIKNMEHCNINRQEYNQNND